MTLEDIIQNSAESEILSVTSEGQCIVILMKNTELDCVIQLSIESSNYYSTYVSEQFTPCYMKLNPIVDDLSVANGVYVAATDFAQFMYECNSGYKVAYGLREKQYPLFLKFIGSIKIIIALQSMDRIHCKILKH